MRAVSEGLRAQPRQRAGQCRGAADWASPSLPSGPRGAPGAGAGLQQGSPGSWEPTADMWLTSRGRVGRAFRQGHGRKGGLVRAGAGMAGANAQAQASGVGATVSILRRRSQVSTVRGTLDIQGREMFEGRAAPP